MVAAASSSAPLASVPQALPKIAGKALPLGALPIYLHLQISLEKLHPLATQGSVKCYAAAGPRADVHYKVGHLNALVSDAHYHNAEADFTFQIVNRGYSGTADLTIVIPVENWTAQGQTGGRIPYSDGTVGVVCVTYVNGYSLFSLAGDRVPTANDVMYVATPDPIWIREITIKVQ